MDNLCEELIRKDTLLIAYKKKAKKLNGIFFIIGMSFVMLVCLSIYLLDSNFPTKMMTDKEKETFFLEYSDKHSDDPIINFIKEKCEDSYSEVECIYEEIPMIWQEERKNYPLFKTPQDYFINGGVCRDASILRFVVLKKLNIPCYFNFSVDNHVFINCFEHGLNYELNNQLIRWSKD